MFVPESIPAWNVEEDASDSATGLVSLGGDVIVPEPPDPLAEPGPPMEPGPLVGPGPSEELEPPEGLELEPLDGGELVLAEKEPGAGEVALWWGRWRAVAVLPTSVR